MFCTLLAGDFDFVLQDAGRPQHADDIGLFRLAEADGEVGRILSEIAGRSVDFKLLAIAAGENFHLGADGALVVVQSLEREPQPVILVAAFVAEQNGGAMILRDQQIGGSVVVVVSGDDGARIFELNFVEADIGGDVFPSVGAEIAEEPDFAFAVFCFADGGKIDPAVVVVIEGGDAEGADPVRRGKRDSIEILALIVAPES